MPVTRESGSTAVETPSVDQGLSASSLSNVDPLWTRVREEAEAAREQDPVLSQVLLTSILLQTRLEDAVIHRVASRLDHPDIPGSLLRQVFTQEIAADPDIASAIRADVVAIYERDPACHRFIEPILFFKGFHALTAYRFAHRLWHEGRKDFALFIQSRVSATFGVDIHPAARIGRGILVDHATGIVVGETAVVEDEVSMLHGVTLGGSGKEDGDRHPKVRRGVLLGGRGQGAGQYRDRPLQPGCFGFGGAEGRAAAQDRGGCAGAHRGRIGMLRAVAVDGSHARISAAYRNGKRRGGRPGEAETGRAARSLQPCSCSGAGLFVSPFQGLNGGCVSCPSGISCFNILSWPGSALRQRVLRRRSMVYCWKVRCV
jgi:serine O-acetyltransferase